MATEFGVTAWGRVWLRTVEQTSTSGRNPALPTARTLARNGGVTFTDISAGTVSAQVTAKGKTSTVVVTVPLWDKTQSDTAARMIRALGTTNRSVSTGELPDSVVADLQARDITVAVNLSECTATCDCSSRRTPCVHHLAAIYALAGRIDEEPALAVTLRTKQAKRRNSAAKKPQGEWIPLREIDVGSFYN
ncbi:SWIM zinc finger family protein [Rhodococcus globerulus]|uniref:SWIM zinc finger family protein n=1 Tax=Rhodococcus globerulus TaxID=33008 RepID=UPI000E2422DA|nr:SWIM zinc finger family protein [Rhodococcus globerulus]QXW04080.1 hypothetical protein KYT97_08690 [Rhodococcus globerulus]